MTTPAATAEELTFREQLLSSGWFLPSGAMGLPGRGAALTRLLQDLRSFITREVRDDEAERMGFPPQLPSQWLARVGYQEKFPHLLGSVCCFEGGVAEHSALLAASASGAPLLPHLTLSDVALTPAACYPVYPALAGTLAEGGRLVDVEGWCYRHEPTDNPMRLRSFQMRELVTADSPQRAVAFRDRWIERGLMLLDRLGLPAVAAPASDPFFGAAGRLLTATQREQHLKVELLVQVASPAATALMSCNCHNATFSELFGIKTANGEHAHTSCVGFGMERIALALVYHHGAQRERWPSVVRQALDC